MNPRSEPPAAPLWTAPEVAALLRCSVRGVRRLVARDGLPFVRVGPRRLYDPAAVRAWLAAHAAALAPPTVAGRGARVQGRAAPPAGPLGAGRVLRSGGPGKGGRG
jgi:excisionase family DNA binding protein